MGNYNQINELRQTQETLRKLTNEAFHELGRVSDSSETGFSLGGLNVVADRAISKVMRLVSPVLSDVKELEETFIANPTLILATQLLDKSRLLLQRKMNSEAVNILSTLVKSKFDKATVLLGTIYMNGVKDRIGKVEFKHPQNAMKCLTIGMDCGNMDAIYLLGTLFRTFGQKDKAREIFQKNMRNGCVKSATEIIILLQIEASVVNNERERAIIEHKIKNLQVDLSYSQS